MKSWIEVSERLLTENYQAAKAVVQQASGQDTALLAVVKANAYGHDAATCAPVLACAGADWLGVTDAAEGAVVQSALTAAGVTVQPRILVMCGCLPEDAAAIVQHDLTPVAWQLGQLDALADAAGSRTIAVHLEIDTGMSRQGVRIAELRQLLDRFTATSQLKLDGVMTHFASAEVAGSEQTALQRTRFETALRIIAEMGLKPAWIHAGNTSAVDNGADGGTLAWLAQLAGSFGARPMVRAGLALYGYCLPLEGLVASDGEGTARLQLVLKPVMTWKTRVVSLGAVEAGERIGYSGTFVAEHRMRLALLPIGYADGLRRELSCSSSSLGGWVMIAGKRAAIVGRISMNLISVDVSDLPDVAIGDEVVVLGEDCTAEDHAALAGTISYEILCGMRAPVVLV